MELKGKVAIVTGAGRGIGEGIATHLARNGAVSIVVNRTAASGQAVVNKIEADGGKAMAVAADVSRKATVQAMVRRSGEIRTDRHPGE